MLLLCLVVLVRPAAAGLVSWVGPAEGDWADTANWSTGVLPGPGDDVTVNIGTPVLVHYATGAAQVGSLSLTGTLHLAGGTLTLTGVSQINGGLVIEPPASMIVTGPPASLGVTGQADISGGSLFARNGAQVSLPGMTQHAGAGLIRAEGPGSRILLDALGSVGLPSPEILDLTEAVSRALSAYQGPLDSADISMDLTEAVSRTLSAYHGPVDSPDIATDLTDAVSRALSVYNGPLDSADPLADLTDSVSRAISGRHGVEEQ
jgi:hypothetical protein